MKYPVIYRLLLFFYKRLGDKVDKRNTEVIFTYKYFFYDLSWALKVRYLYEYEVSLSRNRMFYITLQNALYSLLVPLRVLAVLYIGFILMSIWFLLFIESGWLFIIYLIVLTGFTLSVLKFKLLVQDFVSYYQLLKHENYFRSVKKIIVDF